MKEIDSDIAIIDDEGNVKEREEIENMPKQIEDSILEKKEEAMNFRKKHDPIFTKKYLSKDKKRIKKKIANSNRNKNRRIKKGK